MMSELEDSRRDFIKKAAYVVPAVLSLNLALAEAKAGSKKPKKPKTRDPADRSAGLRSDRDVTR